MTKLQMLEAIKNAKELHLQQMNKIKLELSGKKVENPTSLNKMECECGLWFHANEKIMKDILGLQLFERLDEHHAKWHMSYARIYQIFFVEEKKGFFAKIMGSTRAEEMKIDKARLYFSELKQDTEELLQVADSALRRVNALSNAKFQ